MVCWNLVDIGYCLGVCFALIGLVFLRSSLNVHFLVQYT